MQRSLLLWLISSAITCGVGCDSDPPASEETTQSTTGNGPKPTNFEPASCGTITGAVTWVGPLPEVPPVMHAVVRTDGTGYDTQFVPLGNAPHIDRFTRGVGGAVVFLREVDTNRARPWDLPPVTVELRDSQIAVKQGERLGRTGFVRRGGAVEMRSTEPRFHLLRARGAAFFALAFPEPDQPLSRTFDTCGRVELTSAAGYYWQSAELFVCDHPYYAATDADGRFHFTGVPAGRYDLVVWYPNWTIMRTDRNPETGLPNRLHFAPPLESSRPVVVTTGRTTLANLTLPPSPSPSR